MVSKMLLIERDGPILRIEREKCTDSLFELFTFSPGVISALGILARQDIFQLVMLTCSGEQYIPALHEPQVHLIQDKLLEVLQGEGVVFDEVLTHSRASGDDSSQESSDLSILDTYLKEPYDMSQSLIIGSEKCHELAKSLGCRLLWFTHSETVQAMDQLDDELRRLCVAITDDWQEITSLLAGEHGIKPPRKAEIIRNTDETSIRAEVNIDGTGQADISTGIGFFDHMLNQVAKHGKIDLRLKVSGDLHVDEHHTIEDTALVLGQAVREALGDKRGISRYGFLLPMDECLAQAAIDFSGRPACIWDAQFTREYVGSMPTQMIFHFFKSFSDAALCNLALSVTGDNDHHKAEALFKAFARAIRMAVRRDPLDTDLPSTKGVL